MRCVNQEKAIRRRTEEFQAKSLQSCFFSFFGQLLIFPFGAGIWYAGIQIHYLAQCRLGHGWNHKVLLKFQCLKLSLWKIEMGGKNWMCLLIYLRRFSSIGPAPGHFQIPNKKQMNFNDSASHMADERRGDEKILACKWSDAQRDCELMSHLRITTMNWLLSTEVHIRADTETHAHTHVQSKNLSKHTPTGRTHTQAWSSEKNTLHCTCFFIFDGNEQPGWTFPRISLLSHFMSNEELNHPPPTHPNSLLYLSGIK